MSEHVKTNRAEDEKGRVNDNVSFISVSECIVPGEDNQLEMESHSRVERGFSSPLSFVADDLWHTPSQKSGPAYDTSQHISTDCTLRIRTDGHIQSEVT
jgi:hypothetical protein